MKRIYSVPVLLLVSSLLLSPGCTTASSQSTASVTSISTISATAKPQPSIANVSTETSGQFSNYYAIMSIDIQNNGAAGTVMVMASVTQAGVIHENDYPLYFSKSGTQTLRLVFPLQWQGGDWTPKVNVAVP